MLHRAGIRKRLPGYLLSILLLFLAPVTFLYGRLRTRLDRVAFVKALAWIALLGYAWSMLVSSRGWWTFEASNMLGWKCLPHLPLEECLFYPLGGALSILVYVLAAGPHQRDCRHPGMLALFAGGTLAALAAAAVSASQQNRPPAYLISQLVLYNGLTLVLGFRVAARVKRPALLGAVAAMTGIGFFWNWFAFTRGWWSYHAVLGWFFPPRVPVDDWNFFLFAPAAAVVLYAQLMGGGRR